MTDSIFKATHARYTASGNGFLYKSSTERPGDSALVWCLQDWMWVVSDNWDNEDLSNGNGKDFDLIPDLSELYLKQVICEMVKKRFGDEHPAFSRGSWRYAVKRETTELGYWMWVVAQLEANQ